MTGGSGAGASGAMVAAFLLAFLTPTGLGAQSPALWDGLEVGDYDVGFERVWTLDESRVWPRSAALDSVSGVVARPMRIDVWYPASCSERTHMSLRGYVEMESPGPAYDDLVFVTRRWDEYSYRGLAEDSAAFDRLMAVETASCRDAPAAAGRFPLVVYSAGWFNRAPDNTILAEYLASHGFVVATVPQSNPGLWTYDFHSDVRSVENQVRDLEVAIGALSRKPMVDRREVAAMGYSTGGDVALLLQGRNPLVDAVVGLDASWTLGADNDVAGWPAFRPAAHDVPILAIRRPGTDPDAADAVLDELPAALRLVVEIPGADHGTFSDDPAQRRFLGSGAAEREALHATAARAVLAFLDATLRSGEESLDGAGLAERLRDRGLDAWLRPAEDTP